MDEVDREASTKESEDEGIVNRECFTVESDGMCYFTRFPTTVWCIQPLIADQLLCREVCG